MNKNNNKAPVASDYPTEIVIQTSVSRIQSLIQCARIEGKELTFFLAAQLRAGNITPLEVIDTLRYSAYTC